MCFLVIFGDFKINIAIGSSIGKNVVISTFARVKKMDSGNVATYSTVSAF